jgi:hypothetical protein
MLKALFPLLLLCSCSEKMDIPLPEVGEAVMPLFGNPPGSLGGHLEMSFIGLVVEVEGQNVKMEILNKRGERSVDPFPATVTVDWRLVSACLEWDLGHK